MCHRSCPLTEKIVLLEPSPTATIFISEIHFNNASVTSTDVPPTVLIVGEFKSKI